MKRCAQDALSIAAHELYGQDAISVGMIDHDRGILHKEVNFNRTVGCFTSFYPIIVKYSDTMENTIIGVKDMLRAIPNQGRTYALLYESGLAGRVNLFFNYIGEKNDDIRQISMTDGLSAAKETYSEGSICINSYVIDGIFICDVKYNKCSEEMVERFVEAYRTSIVNVVLLCIGQHEKHATVSDFSDSTLTNEELNEIDDLF